MSADRPIDKRIETALEAGAALAAAGEYHAAHDPLEAVWLAVEAGDDERLLHGLIQFTAAVHHARRGNWSGAAGLGESADGYLADVSASRGVELRPIRAFCRQLAADPAVIERREPPAIAIDGGAVDYETLPAPAVWAAGEAIAAEYGYDESVVADAVEFARADRERSVGSATDETDDTFTRFLRAFLLAAADRGVVFERLAGHVERRRQERDDVAGLFD